MPIEIRPVRPEEHEAAGRVTALAYREFVDNDDWDRYLDRIADIGSRAMQSQAATGSAISPPSTRTTAPVTGWGCSNSRVWR